MSLFRLQSVFVAGWFGLMLAVIAATVAAGQPVTAVAMAGWLTLGCIPPLVVLKSQMISRSVRVSPNAPVRTDVIER